MKVKRIFLFLFYSFGIIDAKSQIIGGTYVGENISSKLIINVDSTAIFSVRYETSLSFEFKCKVIKKTDSILQIENINTTADKIIFSGKKTSNVPLEVNFFSVDRAKQSTPIEVNYEIQSRATNNKIQSIRFLYNHRLYSYNLKKIVKSATIFIDAENSFLITDWKISGNKLFPYIDGKEMKKWVMSQVGG